MNCWKVENGIVRNWQDMEHLWNYTFFEKMHVRKYNVLFQTYLRKFDIAFYYIIL